ncbi:hypothetical protein, partial [Mesorhizobium sp.]|uniref:hypothetical protein n=1 Tax=Mesorhizobium sp. TaxID=1871066 RepID=UPI00257D4F6B
MVHAPASLALVSNRNAAAIGLRGGVRLCYPHAAAESATENRRRDPSSQKIQKRPKWLLTLWMGADYIRLTNE